MSKTVNESIPPLNSSWREKICHWSFIPDEDGEEYFRFNLTLISHHSHQHCHDGDHYVAVWSSITPNT